MNDTVEKSGARPANASPANTARPANLIQPGPVVQKTLPSPMTPATGPLTSHSDMLAEAYDGDTSEALAVGLSARRAGDGKDHDPGFNDTAGQSQRLRPRAVPREAPQDTSSGILDGMRKRQAAGPVGQNNTPATVSGTSTKASHDHLMLVASQMGQAETASHLSFQAFQALTGILAGKSWARLASIEQDLAGRQMASMKS